VTKRPSARLLLLLLIIINIIIVIIIRVKNVFITEIKFRFLCSTSWIVFYSKRKGKNLNFRCQKVSAPPSVFFTVETGPNGSLSVKGCRLLV